MGYYTHSVLFYQARHIAIQAEPLKIPARAQNLGYGAIQAKGLHLRPGI
jgi:hypothetical protein